MVVNIINVQTNKKSLFYFRVTPEYSDIQSIGQPERNLRNFNHVNLLLQHQCANC